MKRPKHTWLTAGLVLLVGIGGAGLAGYRLMGPQVVDSGGIVVQIPPGSGAGEMARLLHARGVIRSSVALRLVAWLSGRSRHLQAGEYLFQGTVTVGDVLDRLESGDVLLHTVTIPEGLTLPETVSRLARAGLDIEGELALEVKDILRLKDLDPEAPDLEGYLFPDTYQFPLGVSAKKIVDRMVDRFREVKRELQAEGGKVPEGVEGVRRWVTLASLVEKEARESEERWRVASVFINRLQLGMPLQCDPTVIYALRRAGKDLEAPLSKMLSFDDPYNTYRYPGLPPGPIANPGRSALRAALHPAATQDLYFVADGRGHHRFSRSLEEHNRAVRQLREIVGSARNAP
ncbi:MAG: endolytic transglycosylase MltG [Acidobacteriota bacterium]